VQGSERLAREADELGSISDTGIETKPLASGVE
jgi:hypothetical protein